MTTDDALNQPRDLFAESGVDIPTPPSDDDEMVQPTSDQIASPPAMSPAPNPAYANAVVNGTALPPPGEIGARTTQQAPNPFPAPPSVEPAAGPAASGPRPKSQPRDLFAEAGVDPSASSAPRDLFAEAGITPDKPEAPGFSDRLAKDYAQRQANVANIPGSDTWGSRRLQEFGQGMGVLKDVGNEAIGSATSLLPESVQENLAHGGFATPGGPIQRAADYVGPRLQATYDAALPPGTEARRNVDALGTAASAIGTDVPLLEGGIKGGAKVADIPKVKEFMADTSTLGPNIPSKFVPKGPQSIADQRAAQTQSLRAKGDAAYKASSAEGISLSNEGAQRLNDELEALKPKGDLQKRTWNSSAASAHAKDIQDSLKVEAPDLDGMIAKRSQLNGLIDDTRNKDEARKLGLVKDAMDKAMIGPATGTWQKANHMWAQQATLQDTDDMVAKAMGKQQPANTLDTQLNNYLNSRKSRGLSDEEWQALKDVTKNGPVAKLGKVAASGGLKYLTTGLAGVAGFGPAGEVLGYLAGHAVSEGMKDVNMISKLKKMDKFRDMIMSRQLPEAPPDVPPGTPPPTGGTPPPAGGLPPQGSLPPAATAKAESLPIGNEGAAQKEVFSKL